MNPLVSVVTVSLNAAATIDDTLASVGLQRVEFGIEHICVDGGSRDATRSIIERRASTWPHIRRVFEPDRGIFDAMNKGLAAATGNYVLFLNADDFLVASGTFATAMRGVGKDDAGNPDLILGDATMGVIGRFGIWRHRRVPCVLAKFRGTGFYPVHQGQFTRRRLLENVGGFDARQRLAADVNQFYDLERRFRPTVRLLKTDIAFMQAGGAANAGLAAMALGTREIFKVQADSVGATRAAGMALAKTLQSVSELRFGRCPHSRWFAIT